MDSSNEDIDPLAGENTSEKWSGTLSALNSSGTDSSNSYTNIKTLKECCGNPSDTLKDNEDFMVLESTSTAVDISNYDTDDTDYHTERKTTAFQKKYKPHSQNFSRVFENILLDDDSQMEITQNSICLNRFQTRKRLLPPNEEDFIEINNSNNSSLNSVDDSMMKSSKFGFSKKKKDQINIPAYNFSISDSISIPDVSNTSKIKENISTLCFDVNDSSNNIMDVSKAKVLSPKFSRKTINVSDSVFDNIINNSSITSNITLNNKKTSLSETSVSNVNNTLVFSKIDKSNLNHTYDIPINNNSSSVEASISGDDNIPEIKQNTVFKKPSDVSICVNDISNIIIDESKTEVITPKFGRKTIDVSDSVFDNIINNSSVTSNITLNNKKTSLSETSVSNVNNTPVFNKIDKSDLNHTYDIPINNNSSSIEASIAGDANIPEVKQNTVFIKPSNVSICVNDISNSIIDESKTEVITPKFGRKTIDVSDSVFDNIINNSSVTSKITLNNKKTSLSETSVSNVNNTPTFSKIDKSNLNQTYDVPINNNTFTVDVSIVGDANVDPEFKQNNVLKKPLNSSLAVNDTSNSIMDTSKTEVFINKFSRKTIDVTGSVFDNIFNDSSMVSDITLNNNATLLNHTYDVTLNKNTSTVDGSIAIATNIPEVKQNPVLNKSLNSSLSVNDNSNKTMDVSKTEVYVNKFSRKIIDVADSAFDNIINNSSMTSDVELNNKTSLNKTSVSNVHNTPGLSTVDISNLNTYDQPINNNTTLLDDIIENDKSMSETPILHEYNRSKSFNQMSFKFNFSKKIGRHSLSYQENRSKYDEIKKFNVSLNTDFNKTAGAKLNIFHKSTNKSNENLESGPCISMIQEITQPDDLLQTNNLNQERLVTKPSINSNLNNEALLLSNTSTRLLESGEFEKKQPEHSMCSSSSTEGLILLTSTTGLLESSSPRNQSRMSKHSNSDILNVITGSLDNNVSQTIQSTHSINSTTEFPERHSSSRNTSTSLLNSSTEISVSGRSSRNQSEHAESSDSGDDSLTNATMKSLEVNGSQKSQSKHSISLNSYNEGLTLLNSTAGFFDSCSSSRNKSSLLTSKHLTRSNINNNSLSVLNSTAGVSISGTSSQNQSRLTKSFVSDDDSNLSNTTIESIERNEFRNSLSKRSMDSTLNNDSLTNSTTEFSGGRSSSRNKSLSSTSTDSISNNDSLPLSCSITEVSISSRSSRHTKSSASDDDSFTNATMTSLKSSKSHKNQSKRSISPTSYNESLTKSTAGFIVRRSSSRNKSISLMSKHLTSFITNNEIVPLSNSITEVSVNGRTSNHTKISKSDNASVTNATMESVERNKSLINRSMSPTLNNDVLTNSTTGISGRRSSSRNKSVLLTSKHLTSFISNNDIVPLSNSITEVSKTSKSSKHTKMSESDDESVTNASMESIEDNKSQINRSMSPTLNNEVLTNFTTGISERRSSSRNKSVLLTSKHLTSFISNNDIVPLSNSITEVSKTSRSSRHTKMSKSGDASVTNATMESVERNKSLINCSMSPTLNNDVLTNSTTGISGRRSSSRNKSVLLTSKHLTSFISNNDIVPLSNSIIDVSASGRTSVYRKMSASDNDSFTNATMRSLEQNALSINQSNESISKYSSSIITNTTLMHASLENDINETPTSRSKQINKSRDIEQIMSNITDVPMVENRSSRTRILRSSSRLVNKNKSTSSTRTSKSVAKCINTNDDTSDDSMFWSTLPDESTSKSSTQSRIMNAFQTPKNNKLTIAENIVNTIKMMSKNKQKSTHPGAFELEDHNDGPLTRSFLTHSNNRGSPSILTLVFGAQNTSESMSMLSQSVSEIIVDESRVEENIKQKFKSLYNKESWITKRLYKFIIIQLEPKYNIYAVKYAEKIIKYLALIFKKILNGKVKLQLYTDMLRYHLARHGIIKDTCDYLVFLCDYIPMVYYKKLVPGWNLEISEVKFDPQKYYIPLMDDEEFLNYIIEHLNDAA